MIGQDNQGVDRERMMPSRFAKGRPQFVDVFRQQPQPAFSQIGGEEEAPPATKLRR
jgi:hypothetical protein